MINDYYTDNKDFENEILNRIVGGKEKGFSFFCIFKIFLFYISLNEIVKYLNERIFRCFLKYNLNYVVWSFENYFSFQT